jgi:hypothetical protein
MAHVAREAMRLGLLAERFAHEPAGDLRDLGGLLVG